MALSFEGMVGSPQQAQGWEGSIRALGGKETFFSSMEKSSSRGLAKMSFVR